MFNIVNSGVLNIIFMKDNVPCYKAKIVMKLLRTARSRNWGLATTKSWTKSNWELLENTSGESLARNLINTEDIWNGRKLLLKIDCVSFGHVGDDYYTQYAFFCLSLCFGRFKYQNKSFLFLTFLISFIHNSNFNIIINILLANSVQKKCSWHSYKKIYNDLKNCPLVLDDTVY